MKSNDNHNTSSSYSVKNIIELVDRGLKEIDGEASSEGILVIGDTGEGKSTLINYLSGNPLEAEKKGWGNKYQIKAQKQLGEIKIGNTQVSETEVPHKWVDKNTGNVYWDCPGFGDTKGPEQDIANGFFVKRVFESVKDVKVVIAISEATLMSDRCDKFINLLKKIGNLFGNDLNNLYKCLSLVITKSEHPDLDGFKSWLSNDFMKNANKLQLDSNQKSILDHLCSKDSKIGFFELPKKEGVIDQAGANKIIKDTIDKVSYYKNPKVKITVSDGSLVAVENIAKSINDEAVDLFKQSNVGVVKLLGSKLPRFVKVYDLYR